MFGQKRKLINDQAGLTKKEKITINQSGKKWLAYRFQTFNQTLIDTIHFALKGEDVSSNCGDQTQKRGHRKRQPARASRDKGPDATRLE
jgi:hypothetical protein